MSELLPPDSHHLSAAEGWFELGNCREALEELDRIAPIQQGRLEVLSLRWSVLATNQAWATCLEVAEKMIRIAPEHPFGWIHRSYSLHELSRTREARDLLLPAAKVFQQDHTIPYNLACYECQLGNFKIALDWLKRALKLPAAKGIKAQALKDLDLKPLWEEIAKLPGAVRRASGS